MEAKMAIEILKNNYPKTCKMVDGRYKGGFNDKECELGPAITVAIEALEKQVPVPRMNFDGKYFCPKCKSRTPLPGRCRCGQRVC